MIYTFTNESIMSKRSPRKSSNKMRLIYEARAEKRRAEMLELYTVQELMVKGFYSHESKPLPHGLEVWMRTTMQRDEQGEWYQQDVPTVALCLPFMEREQRIKSMNPHYWEESKTYYWGFTQKHPAVYLYCILDLIQRLSYLQNWEVCEEIPIKWALGNDKALLFANQQTKRINEGIFNLSPPKIRSEWVQKCENPSFQKFLNAVRHEYTPYDYEWQTHKKDRDTAYIFWNQAIKLATENPQK